MTQEQFLYKKLYFYFKVVFLAVGKNEVRKKNAKKTKQNLTTRSDKYLTSCVNAKSNLHFFTSHNDSSYKKKGQY